MTDFIFYKLKEIKKKIKQMITNTTYQQLHDNVTVHPVIVLLLKILYLIPNACQFLIEKHFQPLEYKLVKYYTAK